MSASRTIRNGVRGPAPRSKRPSTRTAQPTDITPALTGVITRIPVFGTGNNCQQDGPEGHITYANDVLVRVSRYSEAEIPGKPHNLTNIPTCRLAYFSFAGTPSNAAQIGIRASLLLKPANRDIAAHPRLPVGRYRSLLSPLCLDPLHAVRVGPPSGYPEPTVRPARADFHEASGQRSAGAPSCHPRLPNPCRPPLKNP